MTDETLWSLGVIAACLATGGVLGFLAACLREIRRHD